MVKTLFLTCFLLLLLCNGILAIKDDTIDNLESVDETDNKKIIDSPMDIKKKNARDNLIKAEFPTDLKEEVELKVMYKLTFKYILNEDYDQFLVLLSKHEDGKADSDDIGYLTTGSVVKHYVDTEYKDNKKISREKAIGLLSFAKYDYHTDKFAEHTNQIVEKFIPSLDEFENRNKSKGEEEAEYHEIMADNDVYDDDNNYNMDEDM